MCELTKVMLSYSSDKIKYDKVSYIHIQFYRDIMGFYTQFYRNENITVFFLKIPSTYRPT